MKLNSILLIDDNPATNLLHRKLIEKNRIAENILTCTTGEDAIEYLSNCNNESDICKKARKMPDLILLDINMPGMSGWEFMMEYEKINLTGYEPMIFMLTTSYNPDDNFKADANDLVHGFLKKPLTGDILKRVIEIYCSERLLDT